MDQNFTLYEYALHNRGIVAKFITDDTPPQTFLNLGNCESREENSIASRFGPAMITTNGSSNTPLADTNVHTLRRLKGIGQTYRFAGAGTNLYRRTGDTNGAYATINGAQALSGNRFSAEVYRPNLSSFPYLFVADSSVMLKDNGTGNTSNWGITPPTAPVATQLLNNAFLDLATFSFGGQSYSTVNVGSFGAGTRLTGVTLGTAVTGGSISTVTPSSMANIQAGMLIIILTQPGNIVSEVVQVISVTATTFTAFFANSHLSTATLQDDGYGGTVAASTTATVSRSSALNLAILNGAASPTSDIISLYVNISDPNQLQQMQIMFDVGDGSFTQSYYMKAVTPAVFQSLVSGNQTANQSVTGSIFSVAGGQVANTGATDGGKVFMPDLPVDPINLPGIQPGALLPGLSQWTLLQFQKSTFLAVGQAGNPGHDWSAVNAWRIQFQTTTTGTITFAVDDFCLLGGSGLSSLGGIAYDYRITYYNANTGDESNPSQPQIPTVGLLSFNNPIQITWFDSSDSQVTHTRVYRRGGSLSTGWNLVAAVPQGTTTFIDTLFDSFVVEQPALALDNDVPVTSTLLVPVSTTLGTNVPFPGSFTVSPGSIANIFPNQQITVGTGSTQEVIYVISVNVGAGNFFAVFQYAHAANETITADARPGTPANLLCIAFDTVWVAGVPSNPHILYYSKPFTPSAFPPQNTLEIGKPDDPIMGMVEFRGLLYVFTISKIYSVYSPGGISPQVYPTAEITYGLVANFGFCVGNGEIKYQSKDGIRRFSGGKSELMSLNVDWLETNQTFGPITPVNPSQFSSTLMAYYNREMFVSYIGTDNVRHRLIWSDDFSRFRNDDIPSNALFEERDTNKLLTSDTNGNIFQDRQLNFDDAGFVAGVRQETPIQMKLQTPYLNQGKVKFQKVFQELTVKCDTQGQTITVQLVFNDGLGPTLTLGTINQTGMAVVNLPPINGGDGQLAYNVSLLITGNVTNTVTIREFAIKAAFEGDTRQSLDSYWLDGGTSEWKLLKQGWFQYTTSGANTVSCAIYTDGNLSVPEFSFTLPATTVRQPLKVRFKAFKCRTFRIIMTSTADFIYYGESFVEMRKLSGQKAYERKPIQPQG